MEKLDPKIDGASKDIVAENVAKLRELFPEVFTEDKIDFDILKEVLGGYVEHREERYSFTWHGKSQARRIAQTPSTGTLRPVPEESINWDTTQHLLIEGDNLEVLKLLQKSYHKKVKVIYIDPPYNTGKEFVYQDNFHDNLEAYLRYTDQVTDAGHRLSTNTERSGRYHTNWLNMMYPRLQLARNLLREDGVIFVSIDDHESANLRKVLDEIFGEENFLAQIVVRNKAGAGAKPRAFIGVHEYVLAYARNRDKILSISKPMSEEQRQLYRYRDEKYEERGPYGTWALATTSMDDRPNLRFPIYHEGEEIWPEKQWLWTRERVEEAQKRNELVFNRKPDGTWSVRFKRYLKDEHGNESEGTPTTFWDGPYTHQGTRELRDLFGGQRVFDFPKPVGLIKRLLELNFHTRDNQGDTEEIILDFFAGSGTTAQAVLEQNHADGRNRRFILVQLPEPLEPTSEAFKAGYGTIAEICKERIRRVIDKLRQSPGEGTEETRAEVPLHSEGDVRADLGFRVFKLDTSNIKVWDPNIDVRTNAILGTVDNIKRDRSNLDVLYELLLKQGLDLAIPFSERCLEGQPTYIVGGGALVVCLGDNIGLSVAEGIAALKTELEPEVMQVIFRDSGFRDDVVKTNTVQILKRAGVDRVVSV